MGRDNVRDPHRARSGRWDPGRTQRHSRRERLTSDISGLVESAGLDCRRDTDKPPECTPHLRRRITAIHELRSYRFGLRASSLAISYVYGVSRFNGAIPIRRPAWTAPTLTPKQVYNDGHFRNGRAVAAYCEVEGGDLEFEVYCLVGNKIMEVEIDGKTGKVSEMEQKRSLPSRTAQGHAHEHAVAARIVEAGCASCIFDMQGVEGCTLAVRIDGKPYLVTGADVDAHGAGLCSSAKKAKVVGKIEGDKFVATSFELQP